ncbi:MAG: hypothetical protein ABL963_06875 [Longimicrobiales bacterium]
MFDDVREELKKIAKTDRPPLISIAIWGWMGDGKTTSLLSAVHYADALDHGLGFACVREHDEIREVASRPEFSKLALEHLARSSTVRLDELQTQFIEECIWPPGTDAGMPFVLRVEDASETRAFAVVTDLPGGSYSENDSVAEAIIKNAHAIILLVAPDRWTAGNLRARAYQNMVRYRIRRCSQLGVPVSVLVTQADRDRRVARTIEAELLRSIEALPQSQMCRVFRVSVIDDERDEHGQDRPSHDPPPAATQRNPTTLILAWVWAFTRALSAQASTGIRVPIIELAQAAKQPADRNPALLEMRSVGHFSGIAGTMLCPLTSTENESSFLAVTADGILAEIVLTADGQPPRITNRAHLEDAGKLLGNDRMPVGGDPEEGVSTVLHHVGFSNGELVVGPQADPTHIWSGQLHDLVVPAPLGATISHWCYISTEFISGVDKDGRLHLLRKETGTWRQVDVIPGFVEPAEDGLFCFYLSGSRTVVAGGGTSVHAVEVDGAHFANRVESPFRPGFVGGDSPLANRAGTVAHVDQECHLIVTTTTRSDSVGLVHDEAMPYAALATNSSGLIAWIDPALRLRVSMVSTVETRTSQESLSPELAALPRAMKWALGDRLLAADLGDGTWQLFSLRGA